MANNKRQITLDGTIYNVKSDLDFTNVACDMEDQGINVMEVMSGNSGQIFKTCRAILTVMVGIEPKRAGVLITKHMSHGGQLTDIVKVFQELMIDSGFGKADDETAETAEQNPQSEEATEQ